MGTQPLPQKWQSLTQFSAHVYCGQTAAWIKIPLGMEIGLGLRDIVFDVDPAIPRTKGTPNHPTQFLAHAYCGQMAGWMKLILGMEVGLSTGDFVLDWDAAPLPQKGRSHSSIFGPFLLWPNGWMHQDATWYGGGPWSRPHCARWSPSPLRKKGAEPSQFSAHVYCGQMAALIKTPFGTEVGLGLRDIVFDVDPATPRKRGTPGHPIQLLAHAYCGQMAGWM